MLKKIHLGITLFLFSTINTSVTVSPENSSELFWKDIREEAISTSSNRLIVPDSYRTLQLNYFGLKNFLKKVPLEENLRVQNSSLTIQLPLPNGEFEQFKIVESPIMAKKLADQYPGIKTYLGQGTNDRTATVRFGYDQNGFHVMILSAHGSVFIDPYIKGNTEYYVSYYRRDFSPDKNHLYFNCTLLGIDSPGALEITDLINSGLNIYSGDELRTYRLAVACTGEYTQYHGGRVEDGLAAIVVVINRINGIIETEIAVRFELVPNNNLIVYRDPETDPYSNYNVRSMIDENQANIDLVIGSENYDLGHVFGTYGGGITFLAGTCSAENKAKGVSGIPNPIGDPFTTDYVAHEMAHQLGGNHTFNGNTGSCAKYRNELTAFEPGSGSTILSYAGVCGLQNLQAHSDAYFHNISIVEMVNHTRNGSGNNCPTITPTGNSIPVVSAGPSGFVIPLQTPFYLLGSATDADGDELTYCWEEFDLGPAGDPDNPNRNAPIFRSFLPTTDTLRFFPRKSNLVNNTHTMGELLPTYSRNLKFRLTVRDNRAGGGGVNYNDMTMSVTNSAGPFRVVSPNSNITWLGNSEQLIQWNVANTDVAPVNATEVNIFLSLDGGYSWPIVLIENTPNDGLEQVFIPNMPTTEARIVVKASNNIFFDICDEDLIIEDNPSSVDNNLVTSNFILLQNYPNPFNPTTKIIYSILQRSFVTLKVFDVLGNEVTTLVNEEKPAGEYEVEFDGSKLTSGVYLYQLEAGDFTHTTKMVLIK